MVDLASLTTLRLGGPAREVVTSTTPSEYVDAIEAASEPVLVVGGGSNLVVADAGFDGTVVHLAGGQIRVESDDACSGVTVTADAGLSWDDFVAHAVGQGWVGVEALSGIPGTVGATPIQNVGAYGAEVAQTIARVRVWDRVLKGYRTFAAAECGFGYRWSRFKADAGRHLVVQVTFQFPTGPSDTVTLSGPVGYAELARTLDVPIGGRAPVADVRDAVLALRRSKGMVLDPADHDTWSAGSFFTNPLVSDAPAGAPAYPQPDGRIKTSAAWLIERAGFAKGYPGSGGIRVSSKHTLALTNRGDGTTTELISLAREIRDGVQARFDITLEPEPVLVGVTL